MQLLWTVGVAMGVAGKRVRPVGAAMGVAGKWAWLGSLMVVLGGHLEGVAALKDIYLAGTFPIGGREGWQGGQACYPAAKLALEDINKNEDILNGYHLNMEHMDSGCDSGKGAAAMYDLLYTQEDKPKVMIISGCSTVCTTVAEAAVQWNLVTVCYGASSPALSNRDRFPTLFRTHPSATVHNPVRIRMFKKYNWKRISVIQEAEEVFQTTLNDLEYQAKKDDVEIFARQIFKDDPSAAVADLKRQDARIIVGLFYVRAARKVLCEIYKNKMYGKKYVWFFIGWYEDDWFMRWDSKKENINCTRDQMIEAAEGHFTTEALMWNNNRDEETVADKTVKQFEKELRESLMEDKDKAKMLKKGIQPEGYLEAPLAYDAVWATALALNGTAARLAKVGKTLEHFHKSPKAVADIIFKEMQEVSFTGISGTVAFSEETGDRMAWTKVEQLVNEKYVIVAHFDQRTNNFSIVKNSTTGEDVVWWPGAFPKPPQDRLIMKVDLRSISLTIYIPMVVVSILGIILAIILIIINNKFNYRRIIQHSHPSCNNLILAGIILCLLATISLGMDGGWLTEEFFPYACASTNWLLHIGFTLAYGAMFTKIWRVHRIATHSKTKGDNNIKTVVVPWKLWSMVASLVAVDTVFVTVWQLVDPLQRTVHEFPMYEAADDEDVMYEPQVENCRSENFHNVWLGLTFGYKGLQLVLGLFLAYETRSVKVKQINDSRLVGLSIYNVAILCIITAPVTLFISDKQNASFAFVSLANVFCCYLSMALVFVPKVVFICQHPGHDPREREDDDEKKTQEKEQKLKKILAENETLQKNIAEKEQKIALLKKHLAVRRETAEREAREKALAASNGSCRLRTNMSVDLGRNTSLKGITVYRGQLPGNQQTMESYL